MIVKVKTEQKAEIKTLHVEAGVRYWEDATINGIEDDSGHMIPFRKGDSWCPVIDIDAGQVLGWPKGTTANIHYKVCDDGSYYAKSKDGDTILSIKNDYVPSILSPKSEGYGDYIIMDIDENGFIQDWNPDLSDFEEDE
jgi:hypothetical protein